MITRLRTSKESKERLQRLSAVLRFSSNAVIMRYALARSINLDDNVYNDPDAKVNNTSGFEITRSTLFGENEIIYRVLMKNDYTDDESFFPTLTNMHLERGLKLLERDYKLAGNKEKFIKNCIKKLD